MMEILELDMGYSDNNTYFFMLLYAFNVFILIL